MAKDGTKDADIETSAIAHSYNCLGTELVSDSETWSKSCEAVVHSHIHRNTADSGNMQIPVVKVEESAIARFVHGFREVDLPAQPIVQSQLGREPESILPVKEPA